MKKVFLLVLSALFVFACEKTPEEIAVSSVSLSQPSAEMIIGETLQLQVSISPSNATDKTVIWGSSKQSVATVSNTGLVSAVSEGSSTITASAGGKSATCQITVSKGTVDVSSITLNETSIELIEGESKTLVATVLPEDATDKTVSWSSSAPDIASVNGGKVNALLPGEAIITATANNKSASCKVVVSKKVIAVESIELDKTEITLFEAETETLVATVKPDDATDKSVTWSSSNTAIATVEDGRVTAIKEGEASITAKAGEKSATCKVVVKHDTSNDAIVFADAMIKEKLVAAFDTNGDGELSYKEAAAVTDEKTFFSALSPETRFSKFDEFQFFNGIERIPENAFKNWMIQSITLPSSIKVIEYSAFHSCSSLQSINIPNSVKTIKEYAFRNCTKLKDVVIPDSVTILEYAIFKDCSELESVRLPDSLEEIKSSFFEGCSNLKTVNMPSSLTIINDNAFSNTGIETIELPSSLQRITSSAFAYCKNLSSISFPESLLFIGEYAFSGCTKLTSVVLPVSVMQLGGGAFYSCSGLQSITAKPTLPPQIIAGIYKDAVNKVFHLTNNCPIYVPAESVEAYKTAQYWSIYADRIQAIP